MKVFEILYQELIGFLGLGGIIEMVKKGDYSSLSTFAYSALIDHRNNQGGCV
jgi:hypothetical protein